MRFSEGGTGDRTRQMVSCGTLIGPSISTWRPYRREALIRKPEAEGDAAYWEGTVREMTSKRLHWGKRFLAPIRMEQPGSEGRLRHHHQPQRPGWPPPGYWRHGSRGQYACPARSAMPGAGARFAEAPEGSEAERGAMVGPARFGKDDPGLPERGSLPFSDTGRGSHELRGQVVRRASDPVRIRSHFLYARLRRGAPPQGRFQAGGPVRLRGDLQFVPWPRRARQPGSGEPVCRGEQITPPAAP